MLRGIEIVAFVLEDHFICKHDKSMSEAPWDEELTMVVFCKFNGYMLAEGWRTFPYVNCNVEDCSFDYSYEFALCVRWLLKVKATEYSIA